MLVLLWHITDRLPQGLNLTLPSEHGRGGLPSRSRARFPAAAPHLPAGDPSPLVGTREAEGPGQVEWPGLAVPAGSLTAVAPAAAVPFDARAVTGLNGSSSWMYLPPRIRLAIAASAHAPMAKSKAACRPSMKGPEIR